MPLNLVQTLPVCFSVILWSTSNWKSSDTRKCCRVALSNYNKHGDSSLKMQKYKSRWSLQKCEFINVFPCKEKMFHVNNIKFMCRHNYAGEAQYIDFFSLCLKYSQYFSLANIFIFDYYLSFLIKHFSCLN